MPISKSTSPTGAVLPLDAGGAEIARTDHWRLLAEQRGMLVTWAEATGPDHASWGPVLQGSSALSRQLGAILEQAGQSRMLSAGPTLFRIELPSGATLQNLVPAVGGGYRGLVRAGGSASIAGHARLVPVGAAAVGAGIAMGPLVALMALSVGSEMLARHQQDKKLAAIHAGVDSLKHAADETVVAQLNSAEQALELSSAAILDRSQVPSSIGLGTARDNLRVIKNRALGWLEVWEDGIENVKRSGTGVDYGDLRQVLAGKGNKEENAYLQFPVKIERLYRALALDSRATVLTGAEASLKRQPQTLGHLEGQLQRELSANAEAQERLRQLLWALASEHISYSLPCMWSTPDKVAQLHRNLGALATAASRLPEAPPLLNASNRQVTEVLRDVDGSLRVLPAASR